MAKQKELLSTDFFYMLIIFLFISGGIAYLFYSMGYSHALEEMGTKKIQNIQEAEASMEVDRDNAL